ncbi:STAS domain-containing protein [Solwaraspora sp. WMMD791]|uniref:STAS domain-containing protein n=1 Tax=Solwaraspora sp. WMMD791 TaxID=3016086 RepID=UPI00249C34FE|nr:STAS domain-containing protein [Solwaraspora sp. WMMD791]WFE28625.1 STAS domain-containing protein [Solwaraspora sp. WMMD791]
MTTDTNAPQDAVLRLAGDLDFQTAALVHQQVDLALAARPAQLVLDLRGLTFIDSTGLAAIVYAWRVAQEQQATVRLHEVPAFLASVLDITGVGELLARPLPEAADPDASTA